MKTFIFAFSTILLIGSCSSEPTVIHLRTEKGKKNVSDPVLANQIITLEVEGMTCEMGCGGSIRKELKATGGVKRVEFINFTEGQKKQSAKVYFDSNKVSEDEMLKILSTMNEKQFKVKVTNSETITTSNTTIIEKSTTTEKEDVSISSSSFVIPNLFEILSRFVQ